MPVLSIGPPLVLVMASSRCAAPVASHAASTASRHAVSAVGHAILATGCVADGVKTLASP